MRRTQLHQVSGPGVPSATKPLLRSRSIPLFCLPARWHRHKQANSKFSKAYRRALPTLKKRLHASFVTGTRLEILEMGRGAPSSPTDPGSTGGTRTGRRIKEARLCESASWGEVALNFAYGARLSTFCNANQTGLACTHGHDSLSRNSRWRCTQMFYSLINTADPRPRTLWPQTLKNYLRTASTDTVAHTLPPQI
jgi:hypothetical protein